MRKQTALRIIAPTIGCLAAGIGIGWAAFAPGSNLYMNGALVSSHILQHNGTAYAPIADIARALNLTVVPKADGYAITTAGGQNQVGDLNGKIGDKLTNGQWTFQVLKVMRTDHYTRQIGTGEAKIADPANNEIVEVVCRIKNASPEAIRLIVPGGTNTCVTDQDSHTFPVNQDSSDFKEYNTKVLPAAAVDFVIGFDVPKGTKLGDLIYQMYCYGASFHLKDTNFRVSMAPANP